MELDLSLDTGARRVLRETSLLPRAGGVPWTVGSAVESRRATPGVLYDRKYRTCRGGESKSNVRQASEVRDRKRGPHGPTVIKIDQREDATGTHIVQQCLL